jgi:hypothetical protein
MWILDKLIGLPSLTVFASEHAHDNPIVDINRPLHLAISVPITSARPTSSTKYYNASREIFPWTLYHNTISFNLISLKIMLCWKSFCISINISVNMLSILSQFLVMLPKLFMRYFFNRDSTILSYVVFAFFHTSLLLTFFSNFIFLGNSLSRSYKYMWYRQSKAMHLGKTVTTAIIRGWSRSVTMTFTSS